MCEVLGRCGLFGRESLVYQVPLSQGRMVYMRVDRTNYRNAERTVVMVDATRFLDLWRVDPCDVHGDVARQGPETWPTDYKYHYAADGFKEGLGNPVPLAEVGCSMSNVMRTMRETRWLFFRRPTGTRYWTFPYVTFTNGVTRTIWLLSNGAEIFPVEVPTAEAELLQRHAGAGRALQTVDELIPLRELYR